MAKPNNQRAYLGLDWIISLLLAIFPPTNIVLGVVTRVQREKIVPAIFNVLLAPFFYIVDLITIIFSKDLTVFA